MNSAREQFFGGRGMNILKRKNDPMLRFYTINVGCGILIAMRPITPTFFIYSCQ